MADMDENIMDNTNGQKHNGRNHCPFVSICFVHYVLVHIVHIF